MATKTTPARPADGAANAQAESPADEQVGSLLLPIGHYVGVQYRGGAAGQTHRQVRRGGVFHDLSDDQYALWALAHGTPDAIQNELTWHRGLVEQQAPATVADPAAVIDELVDLGLLVEVASADGQAQEFATRHRLMPLMLGLGNSPDEPDLFGIGFLQQPIVQVSHAIYDIWQWSTMDDSLLATCENAADVARRSGSTAPEFTDPARLLVGMLSALHTLLFTNAACLDIGFRLSWPPGPLQSGPAASGVSDNQGGGDD